MNVDTTNLQQETDPRVAAVVASLAGFCHALGQPATVIMSAMELLKMDALDEKTHNEMLDVCLEAAIQIRDLLAEMKRRRTYLAEAYVHSSPNAGEIISMPEWSERMPVANG